MPDIDKHDDRFESWKLYKNKINRRIFVAFLSISVLSILSFMPYIKHFIRSYHFTEKFITSYPILFLVDTWVIELFYSIFIMATSSISCIFIIKISHKLQYPHKYICLAMSYLFMCIIIGSVHATLYYCGIAEYNFDQRIFKKSVDTQYGRYTNAIISIRKRINALSSFKDATMMSEYEIYEEFESSPIVFKRIAIDKKLNIKLELRYSAEARCMAKIYLNGIHAVIEGYPSDKLSYTNLAYKLLCLGELRSANMITRDHINSILNATIDQYVYYMDFLTDKMAQENSTISLYYFIEDTIYNSFRINFPNNSAEIIPINVLSHTLFYIHALFTIAATSLLYRPITAFLEKITKSSNK